MTSELPAHLAAVLLTVFALVATIDGVWLHLWKLRLHARRASYVEHVWHTASAVLFVPIVVLLFAVASSGWLLWLAMALLVGMHVVEAFDVRSERESRRALGGLSRFELSIHVAAVVSRTAAIALLLFARPAAIWSPSAALVSAELPTVVSQLGQAVALGALGIAALHVVLAVIHCPVCGCRPLAEA